MPIDPDLREWVEQEQSKGAERVRRARLYGYLVTYGLTVLAAAYSAWGTP